MMGHIAFVDSDCCVCWLHGLKMPAAAVAESGGPANRSLSDR